MLDYRAIAALHAIIETQGFETAAQKLFITQSAVSQRIRTLENYYGKPVLIRTLPYRPTELGKSLLGHYKRLMFLEESLKLTLSTEKQSPRISIAISRDSLETWFVEVMERLETILPITLEALADDQEDTLEYLKKGLVSACASTEARPITGCHAKFLGYFDYVLVASPEFIHNYFKHKKDRVKNLRKAPHVIFDSKDYLHARYLKKFFNITDAGSHYHVVPSVAGFRQFALKGHACALIPEIDIKKELVQKKLINLFPDKIWKMPIYWHSWVLENKNYEEFNDLVLKVAKNILRQS